MTKIKLLGKRQSTEDKIFSVVLGILCILLLFSILYPLYFIIIASFSDSNAVAAGKVILLPKNINFFGYEQILKDERIWTGYRNTIFYSIVGSVVSVVVTLLAAYALAQKEFVGRRIVTVFFTITMFFGGGLIPTYLLYQDLHLIDNPFVFIIPGAMNVYNMIIARTFFSSSIFKSLYEAAELDGCSQFKFFMQIAVPLSKAIIAVIFLYCFVGKWNDYMTGLIYINDENLQPLQMVLRDILILNDSTPGGTAGVGGGYAQAFKDQVKYGVIIVSTLPLLVIYPFLQKYFEKGVMIGSLKG